MPIPNNVKEVISIFKRIPRELVKCVWCGKEHDRTDQYVVQYTVQQSVDGVLSDIEYLDPVCPECANKVKKRIP